MADHFSFMDNVRLIIIFALLIVMSIVILYFRIKRAAGKNGRKEMARTEELKRRNSVTHGASLDNFKAKEKETAEREEGIEAGKLDSSLNPGAEPVFDLQEAMSIAKEDLESEIDNKLQDVFLKIQEREQIIIDKMTSIMETRFREILNKIDSMGEGVSKREENVKNKKTKKLTRSQRAKKKRAETLSESSKSTAISQKEGAKDVVGVALGKGGKKIDKREVLEGNGEFDIHQFLDELEEPNSGKEGKPDIDVNEKER